MANTAAYNFIKKHKYKMLIILLLPFIMALISLVLNIIFTSGTILGTYIRNIEENGICI